MLTGAVAMSEHLVGGAACSAPRTGPSNDRGTRAPRLGLLGEHGHGEPVACVTDRLMPGEIAPLVQLLLGVARGLRQPRGELVHPLVHDGVELAFGYRTIDEPPLGRLRGRDLVAGRRSPAPAGLRPSAEAIVSPHPPGQSRGLSPTCWMKAVSTITERSHTPSAAHSLAVWIPLTRAIVGFPISRRRSCMSLNAPNHFQYSLELPRSSSSQSEDQRRRRTRGRCP